MTMLESKKSLETLQRVRITLVNPSVDQGSYAVKRIVGETIRVESQVFADGHDILRATLLYRMRNTSHWHRVEMTFQDCDTFAASFCVQDPGFYEFVIEGFVDPILSWQDTFTKKVTAHETPEELRTSLETGFGVIQSATKGGAYHEEALEWIRSVQNAVDPFSQALEPLSLPTDYIESAYVTRSSCVYPIQVTPKLARCSSWYELFPRSCGQEGRHGTFRDVIEMLPYVSQMGFDVLYFPPIHPIGSSHRKGKNNSLEAFAHDPGSPWGIGSQEGGHDAIHPELGTLEDFRALVVRAEELGLSVALDLAFQCSMDHPYLQQHPEWFFWRADGTVQYAENPPKKYQDVTHLSMSHTKAQDLWIELKSVVFHWMDQGVKIFRVDNPHTKPVAFWQWLIAQVHERDPEVIFLAEAFTKPNMMYELAKIGFSQSYTYFTWRNTKQELTSYLQELSSTPVSDFFYPNFWPNTPDILPEYLKFGGVPGSKIRLILAATMSGNYGIYGPVFEKVDTRGLPNREEYQDSEKYEIKSWDWNRNDPLVSLITKLNHLRRRYEALQTHKGIRFIETGHDKILAYLKEEGDVPLLIVVSIDYQYEASCTFTLPSPFHAPGQSPLFVQELLEGTTSFWDQSHLNVCLTPDQPAKIWRVLEQQKREEDFDYFSM